MGRADCSQERRKWRPPLRSMILSMTAGEEKEAEAEPEPQEARMIGEDAACGKTGREKEDEVVAAAEVLLSAICIFFGGAGAAVAMSCST